MKKIFTLLTIALVIATFSCTPKTIKSHKQELKHLTILYINDYHGHITPFKAHYKDDFTVGGMARIATIVKEVKQENADNGIPTIFLCAGDVLQGTPMSTVFKGEPDFLCLNKIGLNAMVLGNHEFDYGQENLNTLRKLANFAVLGANVLSERGQAPIVRTYFTKNIRGIRIHILGLVTDETPLSTHPKNVKSLVFRDPIATAQELLGKLDAGNLTIALTHLGYEMDKKLAQSTTGIDIIIGGHSHTKIETPEKIKNTIICQAFEYGEYVGRLDLEFEDGVIARYEGILIPVSEEIEENPEIKAIIDEYASKLDKRLKDVIGIAHTPLNGEREAVRSRETNLGNLITDVIRSMAQADIAFVNGGGIRASIGEGEITVEGVLTVLPYGNHLVTMQLSGSQVLEILNKNAQLEPGSGGFLQVSGLRMEIKSGKITALGIATKAVELEKMYTVAISDFLAAGGDGYTTFKKGKNYIDTGLLISDILIDYIRSNKEIKVITDGRITKD